MARPISKGPIRGEGVRDRPGEVARPGAYPVGLDTNDTHGTTKPSGRLAALARERPTDACRSYRIYAASFVMIVPAATSSTWASTLVSARQVVRSFRNA